MSTTASPVPHSNIDPTSEQLLSPTTQGNGNSASRQPTTQSVVVEAENVGDDLEVVAQRREEFRAQFAANQLPTNSDIQGLLDLASKTEFDQGKIAIDMYRRAIEDTLHFVIVKLKLTNTKDTICQILNAHSPNEKSLVAKAVKYGLTQSLDLLLSCGATLGDDITPSMVYRDLEEYARSVESTVIRLRLFKERESIRNLLDRSVAITEDDFCYVMQPGSRGRYVPYKLNDHKYTASLPETPLHLNPDMRHKSKVFWTHVSSTNFLSIQVCMEAMMGGFDDAALRDFNRQSSQVAPGHRLLTYRESRFWSGSLPNMGKMPCSVIVFPCLQLTIKNEHNANCTKYKALRDQLTTESLGKYASECTVHVERTLDEAYLPGLNIHELAARNDDQVVSKFRSSPASGRGVVPLLIIPQLWLWRFGKIVISAHNTSVTLPRSCPLVAHAGLQLGLIIADCIMGFGRELVRPHEGVRIPPTLDLFENRVVSILSDVKKYMDHPKREIEFSKEAGFHHDLSDCRSELAMIKHFLKQQEEILNQLLDDCSRNKEASYPIDRKAPTKDQEAPALGDKEASSSQTKEASSSGGNQGLPPRNGDTTPQPQLKQAITAAAWQPVEDARQMLKEYQKRIQKIDGDAERIEKNVQDLLSLKRTYASVKMSEASVELARASVRDSHASVLLSVAAIGFAIVTIIFTPLAFLVGLFALNLQGFDRLRVNSDGNAGRRTRAVGDAANERDIAANVVSDNNPVYHSGKIAGIFVGTEIGTILVTCLLVWTSLRWFGIEFSDFRLSSRNKLVAVNTMTKAFPETTTETTTDAEPDEQVEGWDDELAKVRDTLQDLQDRETVETQQEAKNQMSALAGLWPKQLIRRGKKPAEVEEGRPPSLSNTPT